MGNGVGNDCPGTRVRALKSWELKTEGGGITGGGRTGGKLKSAAGLADTQSSGAGGNGVTSLTAVRAEPSVRSTTTFFRCERSPGTPRTVQIHRAGPGGIRRCLGQGWRAGRGGAWRWVWLLGSTMGCNRLIVLNGDCGSDIGLEDGRDIS